MKMLDQPYLTGYSLSSLDTSVCTQLPAPPAPQLPNLARWYTNIRSFSEKERDKFSKTNLTLENITAKMVVGEEQLSTPEKKKIMFRNLQEVLG